MSTTVKFGIKVATSRKEHEFRNVIFYLYIHPSIYPYIHPSIQLSNLIYLFYLSSICLSNLFNLSVLHSSVYLYTCPYTNLFIYLYLSICISVDLSVHISILYLSKYMASCSKNFIAVRNPNFIQFFNFDSLKSQGTHLGSLNTEGAITLCFNRVGVHR